MSCVKQEPLIVLCDGGFGNRFGSLINGYIVASVTEREVRYHWPVNHWCGASFSQIFSNKSRLIEWTRDLSSIHQPIGLFLTHLPGDGSLLIRKEVDISSSPLSEIFGEVNRTDEIILLYADKLHRQISIDDYKEHFGVAWRDIFTPTINMQAKIYCCEVEQRHKVALDSIYGIHLRRTDNPLEEELSYIKRLVLDRPEALFFLCSDDSILEKTFSESYPNVLVRTKLHPVQKINNELPFRHKTETEIIYNISRPAPSVIDAIVDLIILSHCNLIFNRRPYRSTFLQAAEILRDIRLSAGAKLSSF